ncbi:MAG: alkaline phosphatase [Kiritimatiellae bacterium]|nr:alkaline phosphatase [Kiritimatiellia bacterium]
MKRLVLSASLILGVSSLFAAPPKYVLLFIGDGMSTPQRMIAEEFAIKTGKGEILANHLKYHATTRTCSSSSLVTDSAAAATAIACGTKTYNGALGMDADGNRLESIAEVAHKNGKKVGIVTTVTICHATPAGFYAHRKNRGLAYQIGLDLIASGFEYFAGGGMGNQFDKKDDPEYRGNIYDLAAKEGGYKVVRNKADLMAVKPGQKVFGPMTEDAMPFSIDNPGDDMIPTLAELTAKGIELLDNPNGFFMMVEGGKIDYAGHANDAATNLGEVLAFDQAIRVGYDFYKKHPNETLIMVTGDHETGGMAMGFAGTGYALYMDRLTNQKCSKDVFAQIIKKMRKENQNLTFEEVVPLLKEKFGFIFGQEEEASDAKKQKEGKIDPMALNKDELKKLKDAFKRNQLPEAAKQVMSAKAGIGWTSGAHTALPALTTSEGLYAERFVGLMDNTDISNRLKAMYKED